MTIQEFIELQEKGKGDHCSQCEASYVTINDKSGVIHADDCPRAWDTTRMIINGVTMEIIK